MGARPHPERSYEDGQPCPATGSRFAAGADLLFGFISRRYERGSLVVTTNLPFARWSEVFLDATAAAAVIDRIVHHATVLTTNGDSDRLKAAQRNQTAHARQKKTR